MRRFFTILVLSVYFFASAIIFPYEQAKANPLVEAAIPAGIEIGVGVYVTGALTLAALAGAFGYTQYAGDIREHARMVWQGANQQVKQILHDAVVQAYTAGQTALTIPREVYDYIKSNIGSATYLARTKTTYSESDVATVSRDSSTPYGTIYAGIKSGYNLMNGTSTMSRNFNIYCGGPPSKCTLNASGQQTLNATELPNTVSIYAVLAWLNTYNTTGSWFWISYGGIKDDISNVDSILNKEKGGIFEWNPATDTPIVHLPDLANFPAVDVATGNPLTWNPDAGTWEAPGGVSVPIPNVKVGSPSLSLDVPTAGDVAITYDDVATGTVTKVTDTTAEDVGTGEDTGEGTGTGSDVIKNPFSLPVEALAGLLCILKAVCLYLIRLFQFIISIPTAAPMPINNAAFEWFKSARIMGVQIYTVISSLASVGLSVMVYKAIRRVFP